MDSVKEKNPRKVNCDGSDITLYIAKKTDGTWLQTSDPSLEQLRKGVIPEEIVAIMSKKENKMDLTYRIGNSAFGIPNAKYAGEEDIHVLIDVPEGVAATTFNMEKLVELALNKILKDPEKKRAMHSLGVVSNEEAGASEYEWVAQSD